MKHNGFTVVELAIVIVIVGLLIGGIIIGVSLVEKSEELSIIRDIGKYDTAYNQFIDRYYYKPGDLPSSTAAFAPTENYGNGDGDLQNEGYPYREAYLFWRHLSLSGLIQEVYQCTSSTGLCLHSGNAWPFRQNWGLNESVTSGPGNTVPKAGTKGGVFIIQDGSYSSSLVFDEVAIGVFKDTSSTSALLSPREALSLDTKLDDGMPGLGRMTSMHRGCTLSTSQDCFNNHSSGCYPTSSSEYLSTELDLTPNCLLFYEFSK